MKRTTLTREEIAILGRAARLPLSDDRKEAMAETMPGIFELLNALDGVDLGETPPAIAYRAKWEGS
jgi:Asp-tRNA(Asn)/Glu-tRNA(Gln) amidotransferase C subunit